MLAALKFHGKKAVQTVLSRLGAQKPFSIYKLQGRG
jgi:hypothetical protein